MLTAGNKTRLQGGRATCVGDDEALDTLLRLDQAQGFYALGVAVSQNLKPFNLNEKEVKIVAQGVEDGVSGKAPALDMQVYGPKFNELGRARVAAAATTTKQKDQAYADKAAAESGATRLPSGLVYKTITPGKGASPKPTSTVQVHYRGTTTDGKQFDSSYERNAPVEFKLDQVIPCWTEGVSKMKVGEKAQLVCPSSIAYGDQGRPPQIPGGATLVFEVELLAIK